MSVITDPPQPPIHVLRAAHAEYLVTDLAAAQKFYVDLLGFVQTAQDDRRVYLRCLEDLQHHSLVLREAAAQQQVDPPVAFDACR